MSAISNLTLASRTPVTATGTITTTSTAFVLATSMTDTPPAGTYLVFFTGSVFEVITGVGDFLEMAIYAGGVQNADSLVRCADGANFDTAFCAVALVTVDGTQAVEGRWRVAVAVANTGSMTGTRSLKLVQVG